MIRFSRAKLSQGGAALVLILGIVALLTVIIVAFLGTSSKHVVNAKGGATVVEKNQLSEFATAQFVGDIRTEIFAGSVTPAPYPGQSALAVYYPATPLSAVPDRSSTSREDSGSSAPSEPVRGDLPNLIKQSASGREFFDKNLGLKTLSTMEPQLAFPQWEAHKPEARASEVSTTSGRGAVSTARWNRPLLLPRKNTSKGDVFPEGYEPDTATGWHPPDWIYVSQDGNNPPKKQGDSPIVGRYAYQAYDVGGLLDMNVAGYDPGDVPLMNASKKGSIGLADLTQVGLTPAQVKALIKFRNPSVPPTKSNSGPFGNNYVNFLLKTPDAKSPAWPANNGFMRVGGLGKDANKAFTSRQQLKSFLLNGFGSGSSDASGATAMMDALQYFTHFSRSLEQPSYRPGFYLYDSGGARTRSNSGVAGQPSTPTSPVFIRPSIVPPKDKVDDILYPSGVLGGVNNIVTQNSLPYEMALGNNRGGNDAWGTFEERIGKNPIRIKTSNVVPASAPLTTALQDVINPAFLEVRVVQSFTRLDNTPAVKGEPLVKKRFPLERLSWITPRGPSALIEPSSALYNSLGTPDNIKKAFGLTWTPADRNDPEQTHFWVYDHGRTGEILTLSEIANGQDGSNKMGREPDFIELLYATIAVGSVGKSAVSSHNAGNPWDPATYQQVRDRTSRFQILEIAANIIDQYDSDSFPTIIKLPNPTPNPDNSRATPLYPALFTARGVEDLPYFYRLQWRAVENRNDTPKGLAADPPLDITGGVGIQEITPYVGRDSIGGGNFKSSFICGTTSLIAFPELWNPHAKKSVPGSETGAMEFRVVAASQTPHDILFSSLPSAFTGGAGSSDRGLMNNPKLSDADPTTPAERAWLTDPAIFTFSSRTRGTFMYSYPQGNGNPNLAPWPPGGEYPSDLGSPMAMPMNKPGTSAPYSPALYWSGDVNIMGVNTDVSAGTTSVVGGSLILSGSLYEYSFLNVPAGITSPSNADDQLTRIVSIGNRAGTFFSGTLTTATSGTLSAGTISFTNPIIPDFYKPDVLPESASSYLAPANYYVLPSAAPFSISPGASGSRFPPRIDSGMSPSRNWGKDAYIRVSLSHQDAGRGTPANRHQYNVGGGGRKWIDFRGTELLFKNTPNSDLFREPTPLCIAKFPDGSDLKAGAGNFFSAEPYSGGVNDGTNIWIGFSLGEAPSQYITAFRGELATATGVAMGENDLGIDTYAAVVNPYPPAILLKQNMIPATLAPKAIGVPSVPAPSTALASPYAPYFRFFAVPVNMVGIDGDQFLTVQVQCKDPEGNWITYDERYIKIDGGGDSKTPVLNKAQRQVGPVTSTNGINEFGWILPAGYGAQMGWGLPLVSSYDPRSSRFGHPGRKANGSQTTVYGTPNQKFVLNPSRLEPRGISLLDGPGGEKNYTDRQSTTIMDPFTGAGTPTLLTSNTVVPAAWNIIWDWTWASRYGIPGGVVKPREFDTLFQALQGDRPSINRATTLRVGYRSMFERDTNQWWAIGKLSEQFLWRVPSINANDYGWFSRAPVPRGGDLLGQNATWGNYVFEGDFSAGNISNFLRPWYKHPPTPGFGDDRTDEAEALRIGLLSENIQPRYNSDPFAANDPLYTGTPNSEFRQAYADPDDIVRRAIGAFAAYGGYSVSSSTPTLDGLPEGQKGTATNQDNRPIVLNRAFQSVAELGYAFRGSPWKNLSFSTPETGDAALLDVFCMTEAPPGMSPETLTGNDVQSANPLVAGKINLNTRQTPVLKALLNGALKDETSSAPENFLDKDFADKAAQALVDRTSSSKPWLGPLTNVSELAGKLFGKDIPAGEFNLANDPVYTSISYKTEYNTQLLRGWQRNPDMNPESSQLTWHFSGFSADLDAAFSTSKDKKNLRMRESIIRALADGGQTRVWNIMLDLIAQTGKLTPGTDDLNKFTKESERRVWVFLAIDRLTGEVLDQQVEDVPD